MGMMIFIGCTILAALLLMAQRSLKTGKVWFSEVGLIRLLPFRWRYVLVVFWTKFLTHYLLAWPMAAFFGFSPFVIMRQFYGVEIELTSMTYFLWAIYTLIAYKVIAIITWILEPDTHHIITASYRDAWNRGRQLDRN